MFLVSAYATMLLLFINTCDSNTFGVMGHTCYIYVLDLMAFLFLRKPVTYNFEHNLSDSVLAL